MGTRALAAGLLILGSGCSSVHTELEIPAKPEAIWSVLTDAPAYEEWNPVLFKVEGEFRESAALTNHMRQPNGEESVLQSTVRRMVEARELNQIGGIPGILTFDHRYVLEPVEGGTRVVQTEEYRGIGVLFWDNSWVEPAYRQVNESLRDRVSLLSANQKGPGGER